MMGVDSPFISSDVTMGVSMDVDDIVVVLYVVVNLRSTSLASSNQLFCMVCVLNVTQESVSATAKCFDYQKYIEEGGKDSKCNFRIIVVDIEYWKKEPNRTKAKKEIQRHQIETVRILVL
mmetsp:Transcript_17916/g.12902  ORF Transcript_17916/g.12902 Transcript_17916/m.12902 type:complete len:120 (-) Transcript_17916:49-408(-)